MVSKSNGHKKSRLKNNVSRFSHFIVYRLLKRHNIVWISTSFISLLSAIFKPRIFFYSHFLYYWRALKTFLSTFTIFHQLLTTSSTSYQLLYYFYHVLPILSPSKNLYYHPLIFNNFNTTFILFFISFWFSFISQVTTLKK